MDVRVGKRARVVMPADVRRRLGIEEGDILELDVDLAHRRLILHIVPDDPVARLRGAGRRAYAGVDPIAYQRALRDDPER